MSDILRLRKNILDEEEIVVILRDTLKGLEYLHTQRKIHRDVKCGNILLTMDGQAKLADFGVAGQLTETREKRNTLIGRGCSFLCENSNVFVTYEFFIPGVVNLDDL